MIAAFLPGGSGGKAGTFSSAVGAVAVPGAAGAFEAAAGGFALVGVSDVSLGAQPALTSIIRPKITLDDERAKFLRLTSSSYGFEELEKRKFESVRPEFYHASLAMLPQIISSLSGSTKLVDVRWSRYAQ